MKRLLTLLLALVLAFSIATPAMAFTSTVPSDDGDVPYELDIYLVEYEDNDFFGITTLPETDRGYAKNEIVAAVVELNVPEDESLTADEYAALEFSGENVSLNVTDNAIAGGVADLASVKDSYADFAYSTADDTLTRAIPVAAEVGDTAAQTANKALFSDTDDVTYKYLFFAKVTGDEASLMAALRTADLVWTMGGFEYEDYYIETFSLAEGPDDITGYVYDIFDEHAFWPGYDFNIRILTDEDHNSTELTIYLTRIDQTFTVLELPGGMGFFNQDENRVEDDERIIEDLMEIYDEVFVDVFGFDFDLLGNVVDDEYFEELYHSGDIEVTVDIAPWTAYFTVPDNIVVDPPKTGDAASILGFVVIVLAAAVAVVIKKART